MKDILIRSLCPAPPAPLPSAGTDPAAFCPTGLRGGNSGSGLSGSFFCFSRQCLSGRRQADRILSPPMPGAGKNMSGLRLHLPLPGQEPPMLPDFVIADFHLDWKAASLCENFFQTGVQFLFLFSGKTVFFQRKVHFLFFRKRNSCRAKRIGEKNILPLQLQLNARTVHLHQLLRRILSGKLEMLSDFYQNADI